MSQISQVRYNGVVYDVAEHDPELPAYTVAEANKILAVKSDGTIVEWVVAPISMPALPTAEGDYKLHIDAQGAATWVAIV